VNFSQIRSIQSKILILFIFLLLSVQLVSFFTTYKANQKFESAQLDNRLLTAKEVFTTQLENRRYYLSAFAQTAAQDYGLKSMFQEDTSSLLVALNNHRKRINSDIAFAIEPSGIVIGQLVTERNKQGLKKIKRGPEQGQTFSQKTWLTKEPTTQLFRSAENLYQLSFAPIKSGARTIGWIGFGYLIDSELANDFASLTGVNVGFLLKNEGQWQVVANSEISAKISFSPEFAAQVFQGKREAYISNNLALGKVEQTDLIAIMFKSKADLLKNIQADWQQLLLLIALTLFLSLLGALGIAKGITKPIKLLIIQVKSIAKGNYDQNVTIDDSLELKQLADEFNYMKQAVVEREKTISYRAYHDDLTDLPNRNALLKALTLWIEQHRGFILIQLNVLRINEINDTLGHKVGDQVILEVAKRLKNNAFSKENYHLGDDNFALVVKEQSIEALIENLLPELEHHYQYENVSLHFQYAMGIAKCHIDSGQSAAELLQKSNVALHQAKKQKHTFQIYDQEFDTNTIERLHLTNGLKTAIDEDQLVLYYQPKLSLSTMKLSHVEALVRWQHPDKGLVPPDSFISIAEKTGQMDALTRWVTLEAIRQYIVWQKAGNNIKIAINISAENLKDKSYSDFIIALKDRYQLPEHAITLEVTEDAVVADPEKATEILSYLKDHGFKLSIDDYGTGYSSLAQLKQLPVQELKIDRSFVQHLMTNQEDQTIVKSTIELAHNMGLSVVAEGIEDEATLIWLQAHKCELAQGYFISRPLPAVTFDTWLKESEYGFDEIKSC